MAHITTQVPTAYTNFAPISRFFSALFDGLVRIVENNPKMRQINALAALSDEQLAARGLKREDIAHYVFNSSYWV